MRYTYQAAKSFGIMGVKLREIFAREIEDELRHAAYLADVIVDLGGEPIAAPQPFDSPIDMKGMLKLDLKMEQQAMHNYMTHARLAEELGKFELKLKLEEMAADEDRHAKKLRRLLKGM
jgi:bacterioferritin